MYSGKGINKTQPDISIITVVYNGEKYLENAILSVAAQAGSRFEYIVVDGGSTDGTVDIIKKHEGKIDKWISEPDEGIYDAMNKGIRMAAGQVIGILNADDELNPGVLEKVAAEFKRSKDLDYLYGYVERMTTSGTVYDIADSLHPEQMDKRKYNQIPIPHGALFVKKQMFEELGYYKTSYVINSDYDFILRLINQNKKGIRLDLAISRYRDGGKSSGYRTFWERRKLLKEEGVPLLKREFVVFRAMTKLLIAKLLPARLVASMRKRSK